MPEPTTSATDAAPAAVEDQPIRERVKELTSQVLQQGRVDPEAVREVAKQYRGDRCEGPRILRRSSEAA
jgi:hypothetical protein